MEWNVCQDRVSVPRHQRAHSSSHFLEDSKLQPPKGIRLPTTELGQALEQSRVRSPTYDHDRDTMQSIRR